MKKKKLFNPSVIITGSSSGLGKALVKELSDIYEIIGIDKINDIKSKNISYIKCDLSNNKYNVIAKKINVIAVINCAAILTKSKIKNLKIKDVQSHIDSNVYPCFKLIKNLEKNLIRNKSLFLNIGSIHSNLTKKGFLPYSVSKCALAGLTKALAVEYMGKFSINILNLGPVNTPMLINNLNNKNVKSFIKSQPTKKIICPQQLAKFIKSLIINRDLSFTGSEINYDNGYTSILRDEY